MPNYNAMQLPYAGISKSWSLSDRELLYRTNLRDNRDILLKNGWDASSITYKFNSHGFRCDEFTTDPTIMFLGCSLTAGTGLPIDAIWPQIVAQELGMKCANLGQGGCSADTAFRLCHGWIDRINPLLVVYMKPPGIRWELVDEQRISPIRGVDYQETGIGNLIPYIERYIVDDNNNYFNDLKNTMAIEHMCSRRGIRQLTYPCLKKVNPEDLARDLRHPGRESHRQFAQKVIEDIKNG
jgi:hypothetical protein